MHKVYLPLILLLTACEGSAAHWATRTDAADVDGFRIVQTGNTVEVNAGWFYRDTLEKRKAAIAAAEKYTQCEVQDPQYHLNNVYLVANLHCNASSSVLNVFRSRFPSTTLNPHQRPSGY